MLDDENDTGQTVENYGPAVTYSANLSPSGGTAQSDVFGALTPYQRVFVTDNMSCPITEDSVLFVDKEPAYGDDGRPLYDYVVRRRASSLNSVSYLIEQVKIA